ncbi:sensor histidine kinase [Clostridium sp. D2Q-14]|uniref:sensor histidine kinase n=1 Tax=Anaeromonas gelatinilytica TaxID=2683194 RepID=UPI00193C59EF|nr:HAMP domain-containing sensor histidine kinase [Anaeromonas gelatinilytica]MBS4534730.1 sensor histidine kinase [Anaeromonas gelatinilytica]
METRIKESNKRFYYRIGRLIIIEIIIMAIILSIIIGSYNYYRSMVIKSEKNNIFNLVSTVSYQLELYFNTKDYYLKNIIEKSEFNSQFMGLIQGKDSFPLIEVLYEIQRNEDISLELIDKEGKLLKAYTQDKGYNYEDSPDIERAVKYQKDIYYVDTEKSGSINIIHPIIIDGINQGFIRMKIDSDYIYETYLEDYKANDKGYISVKDRYGRLLLHPSNDDLGEEVVKARKSQYPNYDWSELETIVERQIDEESGVGEYHSIWPGEDKRVKKISGYTPAYIGDTFLIVNLSADYKEVISSLTNITRITVILSILMIISGIIMIIYIYTVESKKNKLLVESIYLNELKEKNALLMHQSKFAAMGEMLATIAHQLKQPLNALKISLYNIEDYYYLKENDEEYLKSLFTSNHKFIDKMAETIDDFKFFFKPQNNDNKFNIYDAIMFSIDLNISRINNLNIDIDIKVDKGIEIRGESNIFSQVFLNLINNSIDALSDIEGKRYLEIFMKPEEKNILIQLKDNGGGIRKDIKDKLFEPYVTTKKNKGTGIGLYISKIILKEKFNGNLIIDNTEVGVKVLVILEKEECDESR